MDKLTAEQQARLACIEGNVEKHLRNMREVGAILKRIYHEKLYLEGGYETFTSYCVLKHGIALDLVSVMLDPACDFFQKWGRKS